MKFKEGDRVVYVPTGEVAEVIILDDLLTFFAGKTVYKVRNNEKLFSIYESDIEYEYIYNSPLCKALR